MIRLRRLLGALLCGLALGGCAASAGGGLHPEPAAAAAAAEAGASLAPINTHCPIGKEAVHEYGGRTTWRGAVIGFCCPECIVDFEKLDEAGRVAALLAVGTTAPAPGGV
ncbi:MAG: hypothetical protein ACT4PU_08350 [Planctomycetota bacterium]